MPLEANRLQLVPGRWFGWQMIPGYDGERNVPYFSPIEVRRVTPRRTGRGVLSVAFFNALYAEGVRDFQMDLRILSHQANYLVAELVDGPPEQCHRSAVVSHIEFGWIRRCCPELWSERPPDSMGGPAESSVSLYLDAIFKR